MLLHFRHLPPRSGGQRLYQCERGHAHHLSGLLRSLVTVYEISGERLLSGRLRAGRFSGEGLSACVRSTISPISLPRFSLVASGEDYLSSISEQKFLADVFTECSQLIPVAGANQAFGPASPKFLYLLSLGLFAASC